VPRAWLECLADRGLLELPLRFDGQTGAHAIATLRREGSLLRSVSALCGGFMPLRAKANDPTPRLPSLTAVDSRAGARLVVQLEGEAIGRPPQTARRRAITTALGEPRARPLGHLARGAALVLYLSLEEPRNAFVASWRQRATGVVAPDGRSLALVRGWNRVDRVTAYGGPERGAARGPPRRLAEPRLTVGGRPVDRGRLPRPAVAHSLEVARRLTPRVDPPSRTGPRSSAASVPLQRRSRALCEKRGLW